MLGLFPGTEALAGAFLQSHSTLLMLMLVGVILAISLQPASESRYITPNHAPAIP